MGQPFQRGADQSVIQYLFVAALYTWREAFIGFVLGSVLGLALATAFVHSRLAERAFVPYVIASQTIPIIALAPLVVFALGQDVLSVVVIATYLTFFPVTIAMIRGLRSFDPRALELLRSYGASKTGIYTKLRLPASMPYFFTALKIAATASIVGAIIAEDTGGISEGLGRVITTFNQYYITEPEKLWVAIFVAGVLGVAFFLVIRVAEIIVLRGRPGGGRMTEPETQPVVRIRGVDKVFTTREGSRTVALKGIDLDIMPGEFVSLIGPSGCGKSTLLRVIGDLVQPTRGEAVVNGKPAARARQDRDYGMVFQAPVLFDWRSVEDNVKLPLEILGKPRDWRAKRAKEMLDLVELGEFTRHMPYQLSGGMQQRVAIARALSFEPRILLMDEPFGALDEMTRERMNDEVLRIWEQTGTTIVFVTHSIPEAVFLSSRVVVMSARPGRITKIVDIDLPRPRNDETRETERYFALITEVREALRAGGQEADDEAAAASSRRTVAEGAVG